MCTLDCDWTFHRTWMISSGNKITIRTRGMKLKKKYEMGNFLFSRGFKDLQAKQ